MDRSTPTRRLLLIALLYSMMAAAAISTIQVLRWGNTLDNQTSKLAWGVVAAAVTIVIVPIASAATAWSKELSRRESLLVTIAAVIAAALVGFVVGELVLDNLFVGGPV